MPRIHRTAEIGELERQLDASHKTVDLAVSFRVLGPERGDPGTELLNKDGKRKTVGGRWHSWDRRWLTHPDVLEAFEWTVQQQQLPVLFDVPRDTMFVALFAGRQAGKTRIAVMQIVLDALRWPDRQSAIVSLNFKASRDPERAFKALLDPRWGVQHSKTEKTYTFPNGHEVVFRSIEAIDTIRGPSLKTVLLDEAARVAYDDYITALGCGAASESFRIYLATTPKRESQWCREVDATWGKTLADSKIFRLETKKNPRHNAKLIKAIEDTTPADIVDQEFRGIILPPQSAAYARQFHRPLHLRKEGRLPDAARFDLRPVGGKVSVDVTGEWVKTNRGVSGAKYVAGWDFGKEAVVVGKIFRDTRSVVEQLPNGRTRTVQVHRHRLWIVGELVDPNTTTDHHAAEVIKKFGDRIYVVTDAMGQHDRSGWRGDEPAGIEVLIDAGFLAVEPVSGRNPGVNHRVRTVNRALRSAVFDEHWPAVEGENGWPAGEVRLFIATDKLGRPVAPALVDGLENQRMVKGKPEKDAKDGVQHEHVLDALGYLVCDLFPVEAEIAEGKSRKKRNDGGDS